MNVIFYAAIAMTQVGVTSYSYSTKVVMVATSHHLIQQSQDSDETEVVVRGQKPQNVDDGSGGGGGSSGNGNGGYGSSGFFDVRENCERDPGCRIEEVPGVQNPR